MTDIQLPLHYQTHQKGMNGKYSTKNLEIRGFSGNSTATQLGSEAKLTSSSTNGTPPKRSIKLIETKAQATNHNFQVLRLKNNEISSFTVFETTNPPITKQNSMNSPRRTVNRKNLINNYTEDENLTNFTSNSSNNLLQKQNQNLPFSTNYGSSYVVSQSNTVKSATNWNEESNSGWTGTGVMSDRSSVYSIDDGDFDREASRRVNNQLREIESILYEQNSGRSSTSMSECKEWLEKFPHIRILGKQIFNSRSEVDSQLSLDNIRSSLKMLTSTPGSISSKSDSFKSEQAPNNLSTSASMNTNSMELPPVTTSSETVPSFNNYKYFRRRETSDFNNQNLNVFGTQLPIRKIDANVYEHCKPGDDFSSFEEEVFEEEGVYEELFAYDNQEEEQLFEQNKRLNLSKRRRHGLPPITPKAAMKDLVLHFLFDHMWSELIDWISELIKTYAKSITQGSFEPETCKTPQINFSSNSRSDLNMEKIIFTKSKTDLLPSISPTYTSSSNLLVSETNSSLNLPSSATVTKANIIQLKLFDQMLEQKQTQNLLRENSVLYSQPSKISNEVNTEIVGDFLTKDLLQIKQLNRNGTSNNPIVNNKPLNPIVGPQLRVGSGTRRQYTNNYYRKRYSSIEMSSTNMGGIDKNIIIHGAGLVRPPSLLQLTDMESKANSVNANSIATSNSLIPFSNIISGNNATNLAIFSPNTRTANSSIQAYNLGIHNDENIYENEDNDYHTFQNHVIDENSIDEINLLSQNFTRNYYHNNSGSSNINYSHGYNYFGHHTNHSAGYKSLPPIENSLTSKPLRISSANNMKQIKEKSERPMTSTSTRFDLSGPNSMNRRSTTPMGNVNKGIISKKINFSKPDESIYTNSSFLSTKALSNTTTGTNNANSSSNFNSNNLNINSSNNNNQNVSNTNLQLQTRRNSFTRVFR